MLSYRPFDFAQDRLTFDQAGIQMIKNSPRKWDYAMELPASQCV
jgi:hypothetical protein